ncbi:hypothetical protein MTO96_021921 [Rhipicephalus appendiculatus]
MDDEEFQQFLKTLGDSCSAVDGSNMAGTPQHLNRFPEQSGEASNEQQESQDDVTPGMCHFCEQVFASAAELRKHFDENMIDNRHVCQVYPSQSNSEEVARHLATDMALSATKKATIAAVFLAVAVVAATAQKPLHFVVVVEKGNNMAALMITETLKKTTNLALTYSLVELDPDEAIVADVCNAIFAGPEKPDVLIDAVRTPGTAHKLSTAVRYSARRLALPTLSLTYGAHNDYTLSGWDRLTTPEEQYLIHITPPGEIYTQVIRDLCDKMDLATAGIIYDRSVIIDHKYARLLENLPTRHIMREINDTRDDFKKEVKLIRSTDVWNFFVLGRSDTLNMALELEGYIPKCSSCDNVSFIVAEPKVSNEPLLAAAKQDKNFNAQTEQADAAFYIDVTKMIVAAANEERASGRLPDLEYPTCDDANLTSPMTEARNNITLRKTMMQLADWTYKQPDAQLVEKPGEDLTKYAAVTLLRVTTVVQPPFVVLRNTSDGEIQFEGYCIDMLDEIKKILKFEYSIYLVPDNTFGSLNNDTQEWNGMIRELVDKNADIALGPLSVTAERETVVDFTVPYYDLVGISILMKRPAVKSSLFKFLTVLEESVWGCILAAYFFTSFLMYIFDRLSPYSYRNNKEKYADDEDKRDFSLKECLWFCMTSLTPQGGGEAPRNLSGRLVAATWWLFGFIIIASYTANLAAFLTVSRLETPIESLEDLAKQYRIKYAPQNGTATMTYFERMAGIENKFYDIWKNMSLDDTLSDEDRAKLAVWDYPVSDKYTKMWWTMKEAGLPADFEEGLQRVKKSTGSQEGFAFLADAMRVQYATMTNCDLISVGREFSKMPLALAVQRNSPLKDMLSSAIIKLLSQGRLEALKDIWWNKNPATQNCADKDGQGDAISIRNIGRKRKANTKVVVVQQHSGKDSTKRPMKY